MALEEIEVVPATPPKLFNAMLKALLPVLAPTVMPLVNVKLSAKVTALPAVVLVIATVTADTVLLKVVPPELVTVMVPMSVPIAPRILTAPTELMTIFDLPNKVPIVPPAVPEIDFTEIKPGPALPRVKVTLSPSVMAPRTTVTFGLL